MEKVKRPSVDWYKVVCGIDDPFVQGAFWSFASCKRYKMKDKLKKRKKPFSINRVSYWFCLSFFGKTACERYRWLGHF